MDMQADIKQVRQTAEALLKQSGIQITRDGDILPFDTSVATSPSFGSEADEKSVSFDEEFEAGANEVRKKKSGTVQSNEIY